MSASVVIVTPTPNALLKSQQTGQFPKEAEGGEGVWGGDKASG